MPQPVYDPRHGHSLDDVTGYDVIRSNWIGPTPDGTVTLTVTDVVTDPHAYAEALGKARAHRGRPGQYGYTANRYACGCRGIAAFMQAAGNPTTNTVFLDLEVSTR